MKYIILAVIFSILIAIIFFFSPINKPIQSITNYESALEMCDKLCVEAVNMNGPLEGISSYCTISFNLDLDREKGTDYRVINGSKKLVKWYCIPIQENQLIKSLNTTCNVACQYKFLS